MVTLLKENNVAMTKLMKSCQEASRQAQEWNRLKPCPNFKEMENQIVVLRNADEEIAKSEELTREASSFIIPQKNCYRFWMRWRQL